MPTAFNPQAIVHLLKAHGIPIAKNEKRGREWIRETGVSVKTWPMQNGKKAILFEYHTWAEGAMHPDSEKIRKEGEAKVLHVLAQAGFTAQEPIHGSGLYRIGMKKEE